MKKLIPTLLYFIAFILLVNNIVGLFIPLRNADIYTEKNTFFKNDINLTQEELIKELDLKEDSDKAFVLKANKVVNEGIAHFWLDEGIDKYNLRVPFYENYILNIFSYLSPSSFEKYQFCDYNKAIERGVGLCSQHSIILSKSLELNDIDSKIIGLAGHVVVMAKVDKANDIWWVLDPDYGVAIEHNINEIEKDPTLIGPYYTKKGYTTEEINKLIEIYGKSGNFITEDVLDYSGNNKYYFEKISYMAIWIIPILLIMLAYFITNKFTNTEKS